MELVVKWLERRPCVVGLMPDRFSISSVQQPQASWSHTYASITK